MRPETALTYEERLLRVLVHIQKHLDDELALDDLARLAHFSPYHFHRVFRGMVGESVAEYVRRLRLERAATSLKHGTQSVLEIALQAGYDSHEAFTRAFRTMFDLSPSEFRASQQPVAFRQVRSGVHYREGQVPQKLDCCPSGLPPLDVRIERRQPTCLAFVRHVGPYSDVGSTWGQLMSWAWPRGLVGAGSLMIGIVHDDPEITTPEKLRYDACLIVSPGQKADPPVGIQELAGGDYGVTTHRGSYQHFADTYARLYGEWLPRSGRELRALPGFELYRNSPRDTPEADLVTDLYLPLSE